MEAIKVFLAGEHVVFRAALAALVREETDFEVVGQSGGVLETLERSKELMPDVVLMDGSMAKKARLTLIDRVKKAVPHVKIIMLAVAEEPEELFEYIKAGAEGYLLTNAEPRAFLKALKDLSQHEAFITAPIAHQMIREFARLSRRRSRGEVPRELLNHSEREVLQGIAGGATDEDIASSLNISVKVFKNRLKNILEKFRLEQRVERVLRERRSLQRDEG